MLFSAVVPMLAELPDFYKTVDRVVWVVDDIDSTIAGWKKLGMIDIGASGESEEDGVKWTVARVGNIIVDFVEPTSDDNVFGQFRSKHGQGVMALMHRVPTEAALDAEVERMHKLGVAVLDAADLDDARARYVLFDTAGEGKYVLGLVYAPPGDYKGELKAPEVKPGAKRVSQFAFVVRDLEPVSKYWARLGFPAMSVTHPKLWDLHYHDQEGHFDALLGWQRHGHVVYEWIQPTKGPTTYLDHIEKHGEGLHHIAFEVTDIEREKAEWTKAGFPTSQSGAWGERDKPGYGRFAYQDIHPIGGTEVELLWNHGR